MIPLLTAATLCASCMDAPQQPAAPRLGVPQPTVDQQVSDGCARFQVHFDAGGQPIVEPIYNTSFCQTNELKLLSDTAATFNAATGALRVAVVMENTGTAAVIPRVKLRFNADSVVRMDASGNVVTGVSGIVGYQPDSSGASGRIAFWWYDQLLAATGQPQVLMPGTRTKRRWIEFRGTGWTAQVRLKLFATGQETGVVPASAPDSLPRTLLVPSRLFTPPFGGGFPYYRDLLVLFFTPGTSLSERSRVIGLVGGTVVGGFPWGGAKGGAYVVRLPADTSQATLLASKAQLVAQTSIKTVTTYFQLSFSPTYLKPEVPPVPAVAPDTIPVAFITSLPVLTDAAGQQMRSQLVVALFLETATQPSRQAAIDLIGGTVIGGRQSFQGDGWYIVRVPWATSPNLLAAAVDSVSKHPAVELAGEYTLGAPNDESWVRPNDGPDWQHLTGESCGIEVSVPTHRSNTSLHFLRGAAR